VDLIDGAADGDDLFFWGYTFDRNDVSMALIDARERRHITVKVLLDKKITFEKTTRDMYEQIAKMSSFGVQVRLASGLDLRKEYSAVGRSVSSTGEFVGASHSKAILTGNWLLCGSTNWTTSSRGNVEMSTLSRLNEFASRDQYRIANAQWEKAVEFTEDLRHQEEHRGRSESRSRSASAFRR
jgi:phosphatidylserine/phosphatidylglycerophosphate/cardiolipin synthase-like enzyme